MIEALPRLQVQQLALRIGGRDLLQGLELTLRAGECWCVLGRNGAGKSSLLRCLAGLQAPTAGRVLLADAQGALQPLPSWKAAALARQRAYLAQDQHDVFGLSVLQTVLLGRYPYGQGWDSADDIARAQSALAELDVVDLAQRDIRTLSGGERQRVALAMTLVQDAPLLLLDEPTNHLDLAHQMALAALLQRRCQQGSSALLVLHDINLASRLASHVLLLSPDGRWQAGPAAAVLTAATVSDCLGYPMQYVAYDGQAYWLPQARPIDAL